MLRDTRFVVSGATGSIGSAVAEAIAALGGQVLATGRNRETLSALTESLPGAGHQTMLIDESDLEAIPRNIADNAALYGKFSGLVCAAGSLSVGPIATQSASAIENQFRSNFLTSVMHIQGVRSKAVRSSNGLSVVAMSSVVVNRGQSGMSLYAATKGALTSYCLSAAKELARDGIRVNVIRAGLIESKMASQLLNTMGSGNQITHLNDYPLGIGTPSDIAKTVVYMLGSDSKWMTGSVVTVDGGYAN